MFNYMNNIEIKKNFLKYSMRTITDNVLKKQIEKILHQTLLFLKVCLHCEVYYGTFFLNIVF